MREIIRVERRRILSRQGLVILSILVLIFSIFTTMKALEDYNIPDSTGMISIKSKDNLKESKKHRTVLNQQNLNDIVKGKDKSKYLYNINLLRIMLLNYPDKKIGEINNEDIKNFYKQRNEMITTNIESGILKYSKEEKEYLFKEIKELESPLTVGYAEGWENFNKVLENLIPIMLLIVSIVTIGVFAEDPKTKMRELYITTRNGKKTLINARLIAGFEVGTLIYGIVIGIFAIVNFAVFSTDGYDLLIQSSREYFFSVINVTFLEQAMINLGISFVAMLALIGIIYCFTILVKQVLPSAVLVAFTWVIMFIIPSRQDMAVSHYITNFLPYPMCKFQTYYMTNELYTMFYKVTPKMISVFIVDIIAFIVFMIISVTIARYKLKKVIK